MYALVVNTFFMSMPRSTLVNRTKLEMNSPAPTSSRTASVTSAITRPPRKRWRPIPAVADRPPSRSDCVTSVRDP